MEVLDRRQHAAPSLRMGEILAGQHKEQGASRGQRHLRTMKAESRLETTPSTREPPELQDSTPAPPYKKKNRFFPKRGFPNDFFK